MNIKPEVGDVWMWENVSEMIVKAVVGGKFWGYTLTGGDQLYNVNDLQRFALRGNAEGRSILDDLAADNIKELDHEDSQH